MGPNSTGGGGGGGAASALAQEDDDDDDGAVSSWLVVDEETATELSKLLESAPLPMKVRFSDNPYSSLAAVQASSAYVTIDVNEESCGSSFSGSESSVMAGSDVGGWRCRGAWGFECAEARDWFTGKTADVEVDGEDAMWVEILEQVFGGQLKKAE